MHRTAKIIRIFSFYIISSNMGSLMMVFKEYGVPYYH